MFFSEKLFSYKSKLGTIIVGTLTLTGCNQGIQKSSSFSSDCELVTIAFEVLNTSAFKLKIEIPDFKTGCCLGSEGG